MSEVFIANLALGRIGHTQKIAALSEQSIQAELCRDLYPHCRDRVMEDFAWPFATRHAQLQDIGNPPTNWGYRYGYPSDCLKSRYIVIPEVRNPYAAQRIPFAVIEDTDQGGSYKAIVTDQESAELCYTGAVTDPSRFSASFKSAVAWLLASELVVPLAKDSKFANNALNQYAIALADAAALSIEGREDQPVSEFLRVRD